MLRIPKAEGKESVVEQVVEWFFESAMEEQYEAFAREHCAIFDPSSTEMKLEYTEVFELFQAEFEKLLEDYLAEIGSDAEEFYASAKEMQERATESGAGLLGNDTLFFIQLLLGALGDFDTFVEVMFDAKRKYES